MTPGAESGRPFDVLLVEDNPGDVRLAMEALREGEVPKRIRVAEDGMQALEMLRAAPPAAPPPDLILLDLNLPKRNGHEVLAEIRADRRLRLIPVVVFTSSAAETDISRAYQLHANCYVIKPSGFAELMETIRRIEVFWLSVATLPGRDALAEIR